jgi:RNA 2',3'-cyclic 3'-phosphodiesterase
MKKRVFVGIEISDEAKEKTSKFIENLRKEFSQIRVGWEKKEKLHLTLKFLGEIEENELLKLTEAVEKTSRKMKSFSLRLEDAGVFPNSKKAKVLWIDLKDKEGSLIELNGILEEECEKRGFKRESRTFKPHLTIARMREPEKSLELVEKYLRKKFEPVEFEVSEIIIFQSVLQSTGSIYSKIGKMKLTDK